MYNNFDLKNGEYYITADAMSFMGSVSIVPPPIRSLCYNSVDYNYIFRLLKIDRSTENNQFLEIF